MPRLNTVGSLMSSLNRVGCVTFYVNCITRLLKLHWYIATTSVPYIFPQIQCNINELSTSKSIFILSGKRWLKVKFVFFMFRQDFRWPTSLQKAYPGFYLKNSSPVSTSRILVFRLRGCISVLYLY